MKKLSLLIALFLVISGTLRATVHIVNVSNYVFTPSTLTIACNDTVRFHRVNGTHPVISETATWTPFTMNGALLNKDVKLTTAGTYAYYCDFHGAAGGVGMSGTITVTCAPPPCSAPAGIVVAPITSTSAKLSWAAVPGATKYVVQYRKMGDVTWIKKNTTVNNKKLTGLLPASTYQYQVRSVCGVVNSAFSPLASFTTLAFEGEGGGTKQAPVVEDHTTKMGVYPNPNNGEFQLVMEHVHQDDVLVQVYDLTGKLIMEKTITVQDMDIVENLTMPAGFKGNAIIKVNVAGKDYTKDIVIQ